MGTNSAGRGTETSIARRSLTSALTHADISGVPHEEKQLGGDSGGSTRHLRHMLVGRAVKYEGALPTWDVSGRPS